MRVAIDVWILSHPSTHRSIGCELVEMTVSRPNLRKRVFSCRPPSDFNMDVGGNSHHSAAILGRDEDSFGARLVPYNSEGVLGIQEQQQQQRPQHPQHPQPPSVSWQGYAPGDETGGGRSGSAT